MKWVLQDAHLQEELRKWRCGVILVRLITTVSDSATLTSELFQL